MATSRQLAEMAANAAYLKEHGVEEAMSFAVDRVMKERPPDPVAAIGRILCGMDAAAPATPTPLTAGSGAAAPASQAATKELQELRARMDGLLAPLQQAAEAEATGAAHATKLPAGLKDFTPLAAEPEIKAASAKLHELELALVKAPSSETARSELRAAAATLEEATAAKIKERAASLLDEANLYHPDFACTKSGQSPIVGFRYHYKVTDDYGRITFHNLCEAEFAKLPDEEKANYEKIAPPCSKSLQDCEAAIADGNHDFEIIYDGVHRVIESGERDGLARFRTAVGALGGAATDKAVQRDEAAEPTTLLADAALAKPAFDQLASCVAWATGAKLELLLLGDRDRHGREVTSLKKVSRIIEKAQLRPGARRGKTERCCDVVRAMLVCKDMATVARIAEALVALHAAGVIEVVRTKDRFGFPSAGGWRDLMVNLIVFDGAAGGGVRHVCELQIAHEMMLTARKGLPGHEIYAIVRNAMEIIESCGLLRELRLEAVRKLRAGGGGDPQVIAAFEDGWLLGDEEWIKCAGDEAKLATKVKPDEEGRVKEVNLFQCCDMKELPASVGRLQALQKLDLTDCSGLTSLPAEVGNCVGLESLSLLNCKGLTSLPAEVGNCVKLESLSLFNCKRLTSLPDLSGLEKLKVHHLREAMKPWEEQGRKAFALPTKG